MEEVLHPELKKMFSALTEVVYTQENLAAKRNEMHEFLAGMAASLPINDAVLTSERYVPGAPGESDVRIKIYEPKRRMNPFRAFFIFTAAAISPVPPI